MKRIYTLTVKYHRGGQTCFVSIFAKDAHNAKLVARAKVFQQAYNA